MKFYKFWAGLACVGLIVSSFLPWAYYPDLDKVFTGFFSEQNIYGKPGKVFVFFGAISLAFVFIDKVWAKRFKLLFAALTLAYLVKTYILYTRCYLNICPEQKYGLYILIASAVGLFVTALLPDLKVHSTEEHEPGEEIS